MSKGGKGELGRGLEILILGFKEEHMGEWRISTKAHLRACFSAGSCISIHD